MTVTRYEVYIEHHLDAGRTIIKARTRGGARFFKRRAKKFDELYKSAEILQIKTTTRRVR